MPSIRTTLKVGSTVFGLSAGLLIVSPATFLSLLNLNSEDASLQWSMRMIGITLIALAGNMWFNSSNPNDESVKRVGIVMSASASLLGLLTLMIPAEITWFSISYALIGFGFGLSYLIALFRGNL